MGKSRGIDLRRTRGHGHPPRVRRGVEERLHDLPGQDGRTVQGLARARPKAPTWQPHGGANANWAVRRDGGEIVAIEPNEDYEHTFAGGDDPFGVALEFAAKKLREERGD
jgi:hypothetical protein